MGYLSKNKSIVIMLLVVIFMSVFLYFNYFSNSVSVVDKKINAPSDNSKEKSALIQKDNLNVNNAEYLRGNNFFYETFFNMGWPFAALMFLILFIFMFREPISKFINRTKKFSAGGENGIEAETCDEVKSENEIIKEEQVSDDEYAEDSMEQEKKEDRNPVTKKDWEREMFIAAIIDKDKEKTDRAYEKMIELVGNNDKDKILYLELSYGLGDTDAINKLKELIDNLDVVYAASMALGYCYERSNDLKNSELFYYNAIKSASDDNEKSSAARSLSNVLYGYNKRDEAINILSETLSDMRGEEFKVRIYEALADIYDKEKDYENKAFVIDKAVEIKPNDLSLLFKAGHSYAESKYDEISLMHYKNARNINPNDDSIQNNIGVQYYNLKMPIKSIESYKKAVKLGNTLASANLAYRLLNIGFLSEAKEFLNIAKEKENVHQNVNEALSEIPKRIDKENEVENEKIESALLLRDFILNFTESKFITSNSLQTASGIWLAETGIKFEIKIINNKIIANWKINHKLLNYEYDEYFKFEGEIFNNSSMINIYAKIEASSTNGEFKKKKRGLLYYFGDNQIKYMEIDDNADSRIINTLAKEVEI